MYTKYMALSTKPAAKCWKWVWVFFICIYITIIL